jgi:hypothetical protein
MPALADCMMVDWAEMCMHQSSLDDNYDALVKNYRKSMKCIAPKRSCFLLKKKPWFTCSVKLREAPTKVLPENEKEALFI